MDSPSQFSPSQALRRPSSRQLRPALRRQSSPLSTPATSSSPNCSLIALWPDPLPRRSHPAITDRRLSSLLQQNRLTFRGRTFAFAPTASQKQIPPPRLQKFAAAICLEAAIRDSNPYRQHDFGRCILAAEPNPIRYLRRCRPCPSLPRLGPRDVGRRALSAAEPNRANPIRCIRRRCPCRSRDAGRRAFGWKLRICLELSLRSRLSL